MRGMPARPVTSSKPRSSVAAFLLAAYKAEYLAARRLETLRLAGREKYDTRGRQHRGQKNEHRRPALSPEDDDCQVGREE